MIQQLLKSALQNNVRAAWLTQSLFTKTLGYLFRSYAPGESVLELKKKWAQEILDLLGFEVDAQGKAPVNESVLLVGNHISYIDIIVLMSVHPQVVFLAKKEVSKWPVIGPAARRVGTLFVDRNNKNDRKKARQEIHTLLASGSHHLAVFPSGTTTLDEDLPWKRGIFEIAADQNLPIQTFCITYEPKRISAYIDDDNLVLHLFKLFKTPDKRVKFRWLKMYQPASEEEFIERLRHDTRTAIKSL